MNILIINGSPKGERSNSLRLTRAFIDGMVSAEQSRSGKTPIVQTVDVNKLSIKPCLGCFSCWNKTPGQCCIKDDMGEVIEKLLWADITIWSFPLYYFNVPGQLKNLIDRQLPMCLPYMNSEAENGGHNTRYDMSGKRNVLISTCGFYTAEGNYNSVTEMFDRCYGVGGYTTIFCGQGELFRVKELHQRTDEYLSYVKKAGAEFADGEISGETTEKLHELLYPRDVFERFADSSWGVDESGEKKDDSRVFTEQMALLYNKASYTGKDIVLEMDYTDVGKAYRLIMGKDGCTVTDDLSGEYTTQIRTPLTVWQSIARGEIEGSEALMKHLYAVQGDFSILMEFDKYFGSGGGYNIKSADSPSADSPSKEKRKRTNMSIMLIPWIALWSIVPINVFFGSLATLLVCALVPIIFMRNKKTPYDTLSLSLVTAFCALLLFGVNSTLLIPLSYLAFGLMWVITCLFKIPLSAHYSMNDYYGEDSLKNPIFMRTNRILTAIWGILYLVTPVWTYFIMKSDLGSVVGLINSVLPALMGIFTAWFQKWYPAHIARGGR